ncbi:MAG: endolytic transglycosylase MltG [Rhodospirillales bacterium]
MKRPHVRIVALAAVALVAAAAALAGALYHLYVRPGPLVAAATVVIPKGTSVGGVADRLAAAGIVADRWLFEAGVRATGAARRLQAGEYAFAPAMSMRDVAALLESGRTVKRRLTIAEGLASAQVLALVAEADGLAGDAPPDAAEGWLLPETYFYSYGDSRRDLVERMQRAAREALDALWAARAQDLAVGDKDEALVLASLIEKEAAEPAERRRVSAVFHNRLRAGMKLQSDPTVVYAITGGAKALDRDLTRDDLAVDSPYNTYRLAGLPPKPIANPGRDSIAAAVNPLKTDELYFVADGNGGHWFAKSLDEHNRNVARYRAGQRKRIRANGE